MSLSSVKYKESTGKRKDLPKLKTILANPYNSASDVLDDTESRNLTELLKNDITEVGILPRLFATSRGIKIGLESVLRAINSSNVSCVVLAFSIKPRYVVNLIARNVEVKNPTAPVYVVRHLEQYTEEIFGVRALALSLPADATALGAELQNWISARRKPVKPKVTLQSKAKGKPTKTSHKTAKLEFNEGVRNSEKKVDEAEGKVWTGDFISFSGSIDVEMKGTSLEAEKTGLIEALSNITSKAEPNPSEKSLGFKKEEKKRNKEENFEIQKSARLESSDPEDFLSDYQPLQVHKICSNPEKKPKRKRNKNKNKN